MDKEKCIAHINGSGSCAMASLSWHTIKSLSRDFDAQLLSLMLSRCGKDNRKILWDNIKTAWGKFHNHKEKRNGSMVDMALIDVPDDFPEYFDELAIFGEGVGVPPFPLTAPEAPAAENNDAVDIMLGMLSAPDGRDLKIEQLNKRVKQLESEKKRLEDKYEELSIKKVAYKMSDVQKAYQLNEEEMADRVKNAALNMWTTKESSLQVVAELFAKLGWKKAKQEIDLHILSQRRWTTIHNNYGPGSTAQVINGDVHDSKIG